MLSAFFTTDEEPVRHIRQSGRMTLTSLRYGEAAAAADRAAHGAGVTILELGTPAEAERAAELLREVWRSTEMPVPANLLRTVQHTGGYVYGAYDHAGVLLAASMGLLASLPSGMGLHSHITGVLPVEQRRGLGLALKQHQRAWALDRGLNTITWTCDPLVRRNVAFNLHALGATITGYLPDHYGAMTDGVNNGDASDRFELHWNLLSDAATAAAEHRLPYLEADPIPVRLAADAQGMPVTTEPSGPVVQVQLPSDIEALRRVDPAAARAWRYAVRDCLFPLISDGAIVRGLTSRGAMVLEVS